MRLNTRILNRISEVTLKKNRWFGGEIQSRLGNVVMVTFPVNNILG